MQQYKLLFLLIASLFIAAGCNSKKSEVVSQVEVSQDQNSQSESQTIEFSNFNSVFRFSAKIPKDWAVEYVPEIESVNISDQIFIRYFKASAFLTLSTVEVVSREETTLNGHAAVRYEIKKKAGVANFPHQPGWRNLQHKLIDVRFSKINPTTFYVIARNPDLDTEVFEKFLSSIVFHNDQASFKLPMTNPSARVTKKPFGLYVTPGNSPIRPERFSGYHTGTDFEILEGEENTPLTVSAICGGKLLSKQIAEGYGGVVIQECIIGDQPITVVYGHVQLSSVTWAVGDYLTPGAKVALLGAGGSADTDGGRKHLHLGVHKGSSIDIRGYVQKETELSEWLDYFSLLK